MGSRCPVPSDSFSAPRAKAEDLDIFQTAVRVPECGFLGTGATFSSMRVLRPCFRLAGPASVPSPSSATLISSDSVSYTLMPWSGSTTFYISSAVMGRAKFSPTSSSTGGSGQSSHSRPYRCYIINSQYSETIQ